MLDKEGASAFLKMVATFDPQAVPQASSQGPASETPETDGDPITRIVYSLTDFFKQQSTSKLYGIRKIVNCF